MYSLTEIERQEQELQFSCFNHEVALEIGSRLLNMARTKQLPVAIDVTMCRQQLFHAALPGTSVINEHWLRRKINTVYYFMTSSMAMQLKMEAEKKSLTEVHSLPEGDFAAAGGAFPVIVKDTGMVGTIAVSGMTSEEDHGLIVACIGEYLGIW